MNKGLEALENIKNKTITITDNRNDIVYKYRYGDYLSKEDVNTIAKELKALEIVKDKELDIEWLLTCFNKYDREQYNACQIKSLTQEEYDLLKEVLL